MSQPNLSLQFSAAQPNDGVFGHLYSRRSVIGYHHETRCNSLLCTQCLVYNCPLIWNIEGPYKGSLLFLSSSWLVFCARSALFITVPSYEIYRDLIKLPSFSQSRPGVSLCVVRMLSISHLPLSSSLSPPLPCITSVCGSQREWGSNLYYQSLNKISYIKDGASHATRRCTPVL